MKLFPYGVQYYRQPTPLKDEWEEDIKNIKKAGYTHIQLRPQWKWAEKTEGKYYFDDIKTLMDIAEKNQIKVVVKPFVECAPDWIFSDYDGSMVGFNGVKFAPVSFGAWYIGGWAPCFDNPKVMEGACNFTKELTKVVKDYPNLWFYNAWNEAACIHWQQCYCEHSKKAYREWLENKFGNIDNMSEFYGKAYTSYEKMDPPLGLQDYIEMMLWKDFCGWAVAEHVHNIYKAIKSVDDTRKVMCHAGPNQIFCEPITGARDDVYNAKAVDFYGTSFNVPIYPKTFEDRFKGIVIGDWIRSVDENFMVHEVYPSEGAWGPEPNERDLREIVWQAIMSGAKGMTYWQYKKERLGSESYGWGMRNIDGTPTKESEICDDIATKINKYNDILADSVAPKSLLGQIYHKEQHKISSFQGSYNWRISDYNLNLQNNKYQDTIFNSHIIFASRVKAADILTWDSDFTGFKIITVPCDEIITPSMADKLKKYVKDGGNLVIEYPFADRDENTWVSKTSPNNGLEELTGYKVIRRSSNTGQSASLNGIEIKDLPWYFEGEVLGHAEVLGTWNTGAAAFVKNNYGKGSVYTLVASPSLVYKDQKEVSVKIGEYIINSINVGQLFDFGVVFKERICGNKKIIFVTNDSQKDLEYTDNCSEIIDAYDGTFENGKIKVKKAGFIVYIK